MSANTQASALPHCADCSTATGPSIQDPVHPGPREDSLLLRWLMLNDRQTLIKAAPGSPPVTVRRVQRGDDKWWDKSSMPALDLGQISRIRQLGWTLLASSQTTLRSGPPPLPDYLIFLYSRWPGATAHWSSGAMRWRDAWWMNAESGFYFLISHHSSTVC